MSVYVCTYMRVGAYVHTCIRTYGWVGACVRVSVCVCLACVSGQFLTLSYNEIDLALLEGKYLQFIKCFLMGNIGQKNKVSFHTVLNPLLTQCNLYEGVLLCLLKWTIILDNNTALSNQYKINT